LRDSRAHARFLIAVALVFVTAPTATSKQDQPVKPSITSSEAERVIANRARQVITALKARDIAQFATFVHPRRGVRFSPYASVLPKEDRLIKRSQLASTWASSRRYVWGSYDASGDPIRVTFKNYYRQFIFKRDYSRVKDINYNQVTSHGTTPNNIREIYPNSIAVEYFISGVDPRYDGMDWSSLWLVFEKAGNQWYVVGIVHDQWTS
jgi:hypothetical protein